jgi:hypothetical protein
MRISRCAGGTLAIACASVCSTALAQSPHRVGLVEPAVLVRVTNVATGQTVRFDVANGPPGASTPSLGELTVFDTMTNEGSTTGLNVAYVDPRSYSGESSSTQAFAIGLAERLVYRAPMDPASGFPLPTDILWNDYVSDPARWPGGSGSLQPLASFGFIPYFQNTEPPPSTRTHTLRVEFFSLDRGASHGGFEAEFRVSPGQTGYSAATMDLSLLDPPIRIPAAGWVMVDWVEANNSGVGCMFTGGDLSNPGYPRPETLWAVGSADPISWWFADGVTGVDAMFDGDPAVSYLDVLNTGVLANWAFTAGSPPEVFLAHDFACRMTLGAGPGCPCDVDGSGDVNSQDFFDFITAFFGGDADFNGSGETNSQDFFDFLACFFGSC